MNAHRYIILPVLVASFATFGCDSGRPSAADIERERAARAAAERQVEAEKQRRVDEERKHESETSRLWRYVFAIALFAVVLLFLGTALGSAARKDLQKEVGVNDT